MNEITLLREHGPEAPSLEPTALHAARAALLADIERSTTVRGRIHRRLPGRRRRLQIVLALTTAAAAATAAVVVPGTDPVAPPAGGMTLVAVEELTFPLSLDPVPAGMTPTFTGGPGRGVGSDSIAAYRSTDGMDRFSVWVEAEEPDGREDGYGAPSVVTGTGTVTVGGVEANFVEFSVEDVCDETGCRDRAFADLVWQRGPGQWVTLSGEGAYGDLARVVTVGESLVDRPQPVNLQVGLAPAGWSVTDWHNGTDLSLRNDADPDQWLGVQCLPPFPSGSGVDNGSVDQRIESVTAIEPVISTTVGGRPARLVHAHDYMDVDMRFWLLAWELADGTLCTVHAPEEFTRDDVLAIAAQVTYRP